MTPAKPPAQGLKFIGCRVLSREAHHLAAEMSQPVDLEFFDVALHARPSEQKAALQAAVDVADDPGKYRAILLGYGRCSDGLAGLRARTVPLAIPRAHDCITLLLGSREAYRQEFEQQPGTYYQSAGWVEQGGEIVEDSPAPPGFDAALQHLGLTDSCEQLVSKHGRANADYLIETLGGWAKAYSRLCYLEMGTCDESRFIEQSRRRAEQMGWTFEHRRGDLALLRKLLQGPWDDDILVVQPGQAVAPRNDDTVLDAE
jgi:hypothetical protein